MSRQHTRVSTVFNSEVVCVQKIRSEFFSLYDPCTRTNVSSSKILAHYAENERFPPPIARSLLSIASHADVRDKPKNVCVGGYSFCGILWYCDRTTPRKRLGPKVKFRATQRGTAINVHYLPVGEKTSDQLNEPSGRKPPRNRKLSKPVYAGCLDSVLWKAEPWWHKKPKPAKMTKMHNAHTRGEVVLIILLKKHGYFKVFSIVNQRNFSPHTTSCKFKL